MNGSIHADATEIVHRRGDSGTADAAAAAGVDADYNGRRVRGWNVGEGPESGGTDVITPAVVREVLGGSA